MDHPNCKINNQETYYKLNYNNIESDILISKSYIGSTINKEFTIKYQNYDHIREQVSINYVNYDKLKAIHEYLFFVLSYFK